MTQYHEEPDFLTAKAFSALCDCIARLSRNAGVELPAKMDAARLATIRSAVDLASDVTPTGEALSAALKAPALDILRTLFEGPRAEEWQARLENFITRWDDGEGGIKYSLNTAHSFSIEHLEYLEKLGMPFKDMTSTLGRRMLIDPDPRMDDFMGRITQAQNGESEAILHSGHWSSSALSLMQPRHIRRLHDLMNSDRAQETRACLDYLCERFLLPRDWREVALAIRIGFAPEECLDRAPASVLALTQKVSSAHGRIALFELEPDIEDMVTRPSESAFFGLTRDDVERAAREEGRIR